MRVEKRRNYFNEKFRPEKNLSLMLIVVVAVVAVAGNQVHLQAPLLQVTVFQLVRHLASIWIVLRR